MNNDGRGAPIDGGGAQWVPITESELAAAAAEAIEWIVVITSRKVTEDDERDFAAWRAERPYNGDVYDEIVRSRSFLRGYLENRADQGAISRRAWLAGGVTAMAAVAWVGMTRPPLGLWPSFAELMADHRTGVQQRYAFSPDAGVEVELNSRTSVGLLEDGVRLIDGEAFVAMRRAADFRIDALGFAVLARSTTLNVETLGDVLRVSCLTGEARCIVDARPVQIGAGERLRLAPDGTVSRHRVAASRLASWRDGMLVFEREPLSDVVAQLNRYRTGAIVLTDNRLRDRPVSGVFFTDQADGTLDQLTRLLHLQTRALPGGVVLIG